MHSASFCLHTVEHILHRKEFKKIFSPLIIMYVMLWGLFSYRTHSRLLTNCFNVVLYYKSKLRQILFSTLFFVCGCAINAGNCAAIHQDLLRLTIFSFLLAAHSHLLVQPIHRSRTPTVFLTVSSDCPSVQSGLFILLLFSQLGMSPFSLARPTKCVHSSPPHQNTVSFILPLLSSQNCV